MNSPSNPLLGTWRITWMETWEQDDVDLMGPGHFRFDRDGTGELRFIAVVGFLDGRFGKRDGKPSIEFSWEGHDENDPASGRGWAVLEGENKIKGHLFMHQGDESAFTAKRSKAAAKRKNA